MDLNDIKNMRLGHPWQRATRALFKRPDADNGTELVELWAIDRRPIFCPNDFEQMDWTTAEESVLDDGTLSMVNPNNGMEVSNFKPIIFEDLEGGMHIGWDLSEYRRDDESNWSYRGPATRAPKSIPAAVRAFDAATSRVTKPPYEISGKMTLPISEEQMNKLMDDDITDDSPMYVEGQEIKKIRSLHFDVVIEFAREQISSYGILGEAIAQRGTARVVQTGDGFEVQFEFDLSE